MSRFSACAIVSTWWSCAPFGNPVRSSMNRPPTTRSRTPAATRSLEEWWDGREVVAGVPVGPTGEGRRTIELSGTGKARYFLAGRVR